MNPKMVLTVHDHLNKIYVFSFTIEDDQCHIKIDFDYNIDLFYYHGSCSLLFDSMLQLIYDHIRDSFVLNKHERYLFFDVEQKLFNSDYIYEFVFHQLLVTIRMVLNTDDLILFVNSILDFVGKYKK